MLRENTLQLEQAVKVLFWRECESAYFRPFYVGFVKKVHKKKKDILCLARMFYIGFRIIYVTARLHILGDMPLRTSGGKKTKLPIRPLEMLFVILWQLAW